MGWDNSDYIEVPARVQRFYELWPDGRIVSDPAVVHQLGDRLFIGVVTRVYHAPDDPTPSQGQAWEPYPGQTNFTRDSECMNAETSAVGRALAAAGIEVKRSMASANEVRNRRSTGEQLRDAQAKAAQIERTQDPADVEAEHQARNPLPLDKTKRSKTRAKDEDPRWVGDDPLPAALAAMVAAFEAANIVSKPDRLRYAADIAGRDIGSAADLKLDEVQAVTAALGLWVTPGPVA